MIVFSAAGIAAIMGWIPTSTSSPTDSVVVAPPAAPAKASTSSALAQEQARADARARRQASAQVADSTPARLRCAECGVVQSVSEVVTKGAGSGIGAVGGAVAGNEVEKRVKSGKSYEVTVRFEDGSSRVINEAAAPSWRAGDRVKIVNGVIQSNA